MNDPGVDLIKMEKRFDDDRRQLYLLQEVTLKSLLRKPLLRLSGLSMAFLELVPMRGVIRRSIRLISWTQILDEVGIELDARVEGLGEKVKFAPTCSQRR